VVVGVNETEVTWSASDPEKVRIDLAYISGGVVLTMLEAGDVTITADSNGKCGTSALHITAATEAEWQAGAARFNDMSIAPDGGIPGLGNVPPACTACHGDTNTNNLFRTIIDTSEQTGGFSDQELSDIFTKGIVPMGGYFDNSIIPQPAWSVLHRWSDFTADEAQGMVVYLRSLVPASHGGVDFSGFTPSGNGGATGAGGSTVGAGGEPARAVPCGTQLCDTAMGSSGAPCCADAFESRCGVIATTGGCTPAQSPSP
jgi:hypothetical protein